MDHFDIKALRDDYIEHSKTFKGNGLIGFLWLISGVILGCFASYCLAILAGLIG